MFKVSDRVLVLGKYKGAIYNVNDYRPPEMKYAVDIDDYPDNPVFLGDKHMTLLEEVANERAD